jgi:hypothetical protein
MRSLMTHLQELSLTQGLAEHVQRTLSPYVKELSQDNYRSVLEHFMKDYLRLLQTHTEKLNRYPTKKLSYLTSTVSKQIFTEIMRMACDFKLESINRAHCFKSAQRKHNNLVIIGHTLNRMFMGYVASAFKMMKKGYYEEVKCD